MGGKRPGLAEGPDRAVDEPVVAFPQLAPPRPSRSAAPGRIDWTKTSAPSTSRSSASRPRASFKSSASERFERFAAKNITLPPGKNARPPGPRLVTPPGMLDLDHLRTQPSRISVQVGPASDDVKSTTRRPRSGSKLIGSEHSRTGKVGAALTCWNLLRTRIWSPILAGPGRERALSGDGLDRRDLSKPLVGIATTWTGTMPCNLGQRDLAKHVAAGVRAAGGTPMEFNTIAVSDNQTQGMPTMRASLVSREVIADSIELVATSQPFDGLICIAAATRRCPPR